MKKYLLLGLAYLMFYSSFSQHTLNLTMLSGLNYRVGFTIPKGFILDTTHLLGKTTTVGFLYDKIKYPNKEVRIEIDVAAKNTNDNSLENEITFYKKDIRIQQLQKGDNIHEKYTYQKVMMNNKAGDVFSYLISSDTISANIYTVSLISKRKENGNEYFSSFLDVVASFTVLID